MEKDRFIGSWQLLSQHSTYADGRSVPSRGDQPRGILMYDAYGNMAVQLMRTDTQATQFRDLSELATAMQGFHAYFGTYEILEASKIVLHRVLGSGYPGYWNTTQERRYEFSEGDSILTLRAPSPMDDSMRVLVWQRLTTPIK